jgi:hypothetical protein
VLPVVDAAVCEPANNADNTAPLTAAPPDVVGLASLAALPVAETAGVTGAAAALTCEAPLAAPTATAAFGAEAAAATGAEAADAAVVADAPEPAAAAEAASAPDASSAGTVNTAPTRIRLGSCPLKAPGFASNNARVARASVARSRDWVTAIATSFNDCPGFTVYWPPAA